MLPHPPALIFATSSKYKQDLLRRLNLDFTSIDADITETRRPGEPPLEMASRLAKQKAQALAKNHKDHFILGSDQLIALDDQIFQKPKTPARALAQLTALQGKTHTLINAICLLTPNGEPLEAVSTTKMTMRPLTKAALKTYIALDQPLDCAGSYRIEAAGIRLFEATRGDDPTAIEGLPLIALWDLLIQAGVVDE